MSREAVEPHAAKAFVLQKIQPALLGLMDGSVSTLAPLFAAARITDDPFKAFLVGVAAAVGAAVSMGLAEAVSDDGALTGRGSPVGRGAITGAATLVGGMLHTLPFLLPGLTAALAAAYCVVAAELALIALIRVHYLRTSLLPTLVQVVVGGGIVLGVGLLFGNAGS